MPIVDLLLDSSQRDRIPAVIGSVTDALEHTLVMRRQGVSMIVRTDPMPSTTERKDRTMPIVKIDLTTGREPAMKRELIDAVTAAVQSALGVESREVRVLLNEVDPNHWAIGGETLAEREARAKETT